MNRKHGTPSTIEVSDELPCRIIPLVNRNASLFTAEEDRFFTEGEALSTGEASSDAADDQGKRSRAWPIGKGSLIGTAVGALLAIGIALVVRSGKPPANAASETMVAEELEQSAGSPQPRAQVPQPAMPPSPAESPPAQTAAIADTLPPPRARAVDSPAPAPTDARVYPSSQASAGVAAGPMEALDACEIAYRRHRSGEVLSRCAGAFAADPRSANVAVMLAETEFDRGHVREALDWARKAIDLDADRADAYVFLGGAEQATGHKAAAKAAYRHYLKLVPQGRHARDLRAVLSSL
jgi:hypothetical protein